MDLASLVQLQGDHPDWGAFARTLVIVTTECITFPAGWYLVLSFCSAITETFLFFIQAPPMPRNGNKTDEAHPPIHPTKLKTNNFSSDEHRKIYEVGTWKRNGRHGQR